MDIWRPDDSLGYGGFLKANFDHLVISGYGRPVRFKTNSMGFRYYKDVILGHGSKVVRILSLGDSFTAGYRLGQEQTFSRLLEKYLNAKKKQKEYEILVSCINEPLAGLRYLQTFGVKFKPQAVIFGITLGNDIMHNYAILHDGYDYAINNSGSALIADPRCLSGFLENTKDKIVPENCLLKKDIINFKHKGAKSAIDNFRLYKLISANFMPYTGEYIASWYSAERFPRLFDLVNGLGFFIKDQPKEIKDAYEMLFKILSVYQNLAKKNDFKLIILIFPQRFQVQKEDWKATVEEYGLNEDCFDLMKPNNLILSFCRKEGINCIDPTLDMAAFYNKKRKSLYFPLGDMHFNALGNKVLYKTIKEKVYRLIAQN